MLSSWFQAIAESQPQLHREIKTRWRLWNVAIVSVLSLVCQYSLLQNAFHAIEVNAIEPFRMGIQPHLPVYQHAYQNLFTQLLTIDVWLLLFLGSYFIRRSWFQEAKTGTLGFLRLSPQPAQSILWGKLIGVPILLYWAIALAVPLHLWAAYQSGAPLLILLLAVLMPLSTIGMAYLLAIDGVLQRGTKAGLMGLILGNLLLYLFWTVCHWWIFDLRFYLIRGIPDNLSWITLSTSLTIVLVICQGATWRECVYRFHHPNAPIPLHLSR